jgi:CDP-glucose 4,6-dehydratase
VFITGHTGFKGSWLSLWLSQAGACLAGFADGVPSDPSLYEAGAVGEFVESTVGDVCDLESLARSLERHRPEVVFHLAAQPLVRRSLLEPVRTFETNVVGTTNLLEAVRPSDSVRVVVVITTDKVYKARLAHPHREDESLGGADPYSSSKASAELVVEAYRSSFFQQPTAPAVATARAGNVVGGGDWGEDRLMPDVIKALTAGRPVEIRYPRAVRPWQHVLNVLEGYLILAERLWVDRTLARAWNFGPDSLDARPVKWIVTRVAEHWGTPLEVRSPAFAQPRETPSLELDSTRARDELGWMPRWNLERALQATVDWYRLFEAGRPARDLTISQIEAFSAEGKRSHLTV